jgi:hypothetical protein
VFLPARGTVRRLRALVAIGHPGPELAAALGVSPNRVWELTAMRYQQVSVPTASAVGTLFDRLWDVPGSSPRSVEYARRAGWPPPMWWDDIDTDPEPTSPGAKLPAATVKERAVVRACSGTVEPFRLRQVDRDEALRRLAATRTPAAEIARRLGVSKRKVARVRAELAGRATPKRGRA